MDNDKQLNARVARVRGSVLQYCAFFEKVIDEAIGQYFCDKIEKRDDLLNFILCTERITFRSKVDVFQLIVERESVKAGNKYEEFKSKNPKYHKDIIEGIIEERNIFAHYLFDSRDGYLEKYNTEGKIGFIKFKVSASNPKVYALEYDSPKIDEIIRKIVWYGEEIIKLNETNG